MPKIEHGCHIHSISFDLECVTERYFHVGCVNFRLVAVFLEIMAVSGNKVSTDLNTEIISLIVQAYTDLPSHLETVLGIVLPTHCVLTVIKHTNPFACLVIFGILQIFKFGLISLREMKFEVDTYVGVD